MLTTSGKSSLTVQYVEGHFVESYYPTIENTFSKEIVYKGQTFFTEIIDTAGQVSLRVAREGEHCRLTADPRMNTACLIPSISLAYMATCWSTPSRPSNHST